MANIALATIMRSLTHHEVYTPKHFSDDNFTMRFHYGRVIDHTLDQIVIQRCQNGLPNETWQYRQDSIWQNINLTPPFGSRRFIFEIDPLVDFTLNQQTTKNHGYS